MREALGRFLVTNGRHVLRFQLLALRGVLAQQPPCFGLAVGFERVHLLAQLRDEIFLRALVNLGLLPDLARKSLGRRSGGRVALDQALQAPDVLFQRRPAFLLVQPRGLRPLPQDGEVAREPVAQADAAVQVGLELALGLVACLLLGLQGHALGAERVGPLLRVAKRGRHKLKLPACLRGLLLLRGGGGLRRVHLFAQTLLLCGGVGRELVQLLAAAFDGGLRGGLCGRALILFRRNVALQRVAEFANPRE